MCHVFKEETMTEDDEQELEEEEEVDYNKAVSELKPLIKKWKEIDLEVAKKIHSYYMKPKCKFWVLCQMLEVSDVTMYNLFDKYGLPRKDPARAAAIKLGKSHIKSFDISQYNNDQINIPDSETNTNEDWIDYVDPNFVQTEDSGYKEYQELHDRIRAAKRVTFYDITKYPAYKEKLVTEVKETIKWLQDQLEWIEKMEAKNERERTNNSKC
jgi:hypothetical protein